MTAPAGGSAASMPAELLEFARRHLGACAVVAVLSWPYEGSEVYRIQDAAGVEHVVKRLANPTFCRRETVGYAWAGALGEGRAPRLEAADPDLDAIIVSFLPGVLLKHAGLDPARQAQAYRQAGALLRSLHEAAAPSPDTHAIEHLVSATAAHVEAVSGELDAGRRVLIECAKDDLARLAPRLPATPTHGDFWARNLLHDPATGHIAVIDFERAALALPVPDLVRLETGVFTRDPAIRAAFYAGYGRDPDRLEQQALVAWAVLDAVSALAWARAKRDEHLARHAHSVLRSAAGAWTGPLRRGACRCDRPAPRPARGPGGPRHRAGRLSHGHGCARGRRAGPGDNRWPTRPFATGRFDCARKALAMTREQVSAPEPSGLRAAMVERLVADGAITTKSLEAAMRAGPRHAFAPGVESAAAYADDVVRYRIDEHGVCLSSISAPWIQAAMIEAAQITEGMRVLEVGSGGYNAALLSRLVGPAGRVVSVDIDPEAIARAEAGLEAAGIRGVELVLADAEHGVERFAPYDRIIVTVAAWDVPPAWSRQLAEGGRIVLPLALRGQQRIIAFNRVGANLASRSMFYGGFVPMQGEGAHRAFALGFEDATTLHFDEGEPADAAALAGVLAAMPVTAESSVTVASGEPYDSLQLFLAVVLPATATLVFGSDGAGHGLPAPQPGFPVLADGNGTIAYLTMRTHGQGDAARHEFLACALGPGAQEAAERLRDLVREWDTNIRHDPAHPQITLLPAAGRHPAAPGTRRYTLRKTHTTVIVTYPEPPVPSARPADRAAFSGSPA